MTKNKTEEIKTEEQAFYLEGELKMTEKTLLQNEVALRTSNDMLLEPSIPEDMKTDYQENFDKASGNKKALLKKIFHLRELIAELKDGKYVI